FDSKVCWILWKTLFDVKNLTSTWIFPMAINKRCQHYSNTIQIPCQIYCGCLFKPSIHAYCPCG
ncbi:MAG: hypothetical protein ACI9VI_000211, partial [Candidatus Azotimanducaceae bacterium]